MIAQLDSYSQLYDELRAKYGEKEAVERVVNLVFANSIVHSHRQI